MFPSIWFWPHNDRTLFYDGTVRKCSRLFLDMSDVNHVYLDNVKPHREKAIYHVLYINILLKLNIVYIHNIYISFNNKFLKLTLAKYIRYSLKFRETVL